MTSAILMPWLYAFVFTQIVEVPIWMYALRGRFLVAFGASALTHPFVWFVYPHLHALTYWQYVVLAEAFAVIVEAIYMTCFRLRSALVWSIIANGASFGIGLLSRQLFGFP